MRIRNFLSEKTIVVSGHSHVHIKENNGDLIFVNPGSISIPKSDSKPGYALINADNGSVNISLHTLEGEKLKSINFS